MSTHTKTWKIGEYCNGGIITVNIIDNTIIIINKEWDDSKGHKRSSDQSNAQELQRATIDSTEDNAYNKIYDFLSDLTTSYYAEEVIKWMTSKIKIRQSVF